MAKTFCKIVVFSVALLSLPVLAQERSAPPAGSPGCGDFSAKFAVKTDKRHPLIKPQAGKALVYFIEDDSRFDSITKPTTRAGLDGRWAGATHGNSYLYFSVDPGVHHLCASWQAGGSHVLQAMMLGVSSGPGRHDAASSFTAEAGMVYYFEVKDILFRTEDSPQMDMKLTPVDNDEGQLLINQYSHSISQQKK